MSDPTGRAFVAFLRALPSDLRAPLALRRPEVQAAFEAAIEVEDRRESPGKNRADLAKVEAGKMLWGALTVGFFVALVAGGLFGWRAFVGTLGLAGVISAFMARGERRKILTGGEPT